jgi:hypothetical protein
LIGRQAKIRMSQATKCNDCNEGKHHPSEKRDACGCDCYESTNSSAVASASSASAEPSPPCPPSP